MGGKPGAAGEDDRAISRWALKQGTSVYETRDFDVSNQEVREVKDRTSGCERRDFSRSCRVFFYAGLKGHKEMSLYIYIINIFILRCRIETQWTKNLCNLLAMNGLYWDIDCTVCLPWWNRSGGNYWNTGTVKVHQVFVFCNEVVDKRSMCQTIFHN